MFNCLILGSQSGSIITDPQNTSTHTPMDSSQTPNDSGCTHTQSTDHGQINSSTPLKQNGSSSGQTQEGVADGAVKTSMASFCAQWFPLVQIMQLQVS